MVLFWLGKGNGKERGGGTMQRIFEVSQEWMERFEGAQAGILVMKDVVNPASNSALDEKSVVLERSLRERYSGPGSSALQEHPVISAYKAYYRSFAKTYHVKLQLESIVSRGRSIESVSALVKAMFMAELKNMILTAGHDLARVRPPIKLDVSRGNEKYVLLNGKGQTLKAGDMFMMDQEGVISSVLYGPDRRTCIRPETTEVVFAVYAPPGIHKEEILGHFKEIEENVKLFSPRARVEEVLVASSHS